MKNSAIYKNSNNLIQYKNQLDINLYNFILIGIMYLLLMVLLIRNIKKNLLINIGLILFLIILVAFVIFLPEVNKLVAQMRAGNNNENITNDQNKQIIVQCDVKIEDVSIVNSIDLP